VSKFIVSLGRGSVIILIAASAISLTALQASINAPRDSFRTCLKQMSSKASGEKVGAEAYEAYIRTNCNAELGSLKAAVVKFDMGNKMSHKASSDDADSMISDFVSSALDNYKYYNRGTSAQVKQAAIATKAAPAITPPPGPTPASQSTSPK
jgi:hypothetical protein